MVWILFVYPDSYVYRKNVCRHVVHSIGNHRVSILAFSHLYGEEIIQKT